MMRAAWYEENGPAADVLHVGELPTPEPGPGEVRVRLVASGVNPIDIKRRRGARGQTVEEPTVPHFDGAGVVDAVGAGVSSDRVGERVWVFEGQWQRAMGTAAEYIALPESRAVPLPETTGFAEGACLGIPALTAYYAVFADGPVKGKTVLVTGGAGAVGGYAIQFAVLGGARVLTTVSSDAKAEFAADAGADYVFNYRVENVVDRISTLPDGPGVDRIVEVEFGGNLEQTLQIIKPSGVVAAYASDAVPEPKVPFYQLAHKGGSARFVLVFMMPEEMKREATERITRWLQAGELRHYVGKRFPLERVAAAHEAMEHGVIGKVIVDIAEPA